MFRKRSNKDKSDDTVESTIDKETLRRIQKAYNIDDKGKEIFEKKEHNHSMPDEAVKNLEIIIQNARNTTEFYEYLREVSPITDKEILETLIQNTNSIKDFFCDVYMKKLNMPFMPENRDIVRGISYKTGVRWAMIEENKALNSYVELCRAPGDDIALDRAIYLKICNINFLNILKISL